MDVFLVLEAYIKKLIFMKRPLSNSRVLLKEACSLSDEKCYRCAFWEIRTPNTARIVLELKSTTSGGAIGRKINTHANRPNPETELITVVIEGKKNSKMVLEQNKRNLMCE